MNFHNFTFINLCHPPTSPSDTFIFPNKSLLYFTSFCVCYLLSLTRVACENLDRKLFVEGWTHVQALHHWRRWQLFPRHNNCQHMGEASWALRLQWWNVGGPVLCRSWEGNHSCTEFECATAVLGPEDICSTASIPLALSFFLSPLLKCFLSLGGGEADALFRTEHLIANLHLLCKYRELILKFI